MGQSIPQLVYLNQGIRNWHVSPLPFHSSPGTKVIVAFRGSFFVKTRSGPKHEVASAAVITPPGMMLRLTACEGPVEVLVMIFKNMGRVWHRRCFPKRIPQIIPLNMSDLAILENLHARCRYEREHEDNLSLHILGLLIPCWWAVLLRARPGKKVGRRDPRLEKAHEKIRTRCGEPLRIRDLARDVGMSEAHFRDRFHAVYGRSPKEELTRRRLLQAENLLVSTTSKLQEIAACCGFSDEQEFSKIFRKHAGKPPGEWRRRA